MGSSWFGMQSDDQAVCVDRYSNQGTGRSPQSGQLLCVGALLACPSQKAALRTPSDRTSLRRALIRPDTGLPGCRACGPFSRMRPRNQSNPTTRQMGRQLRSVPSASAFDPVRPVDARIPRFCPGVLQILYRPSNPPHGTAYGCAWTMISVWPSAGHNRPPTTPKNIGKLIKHSYVRWHSPDGRLPPFSS